METVSLQQVMNDMARRGITVTPIDSDAKTKTLSELDAFIQLDPLLADINKQYLDAKNHRRALQKQFGQDDTMAEVAMDMEDSAWCAMQTRYLELRAQSDLMRQVQKMIRDCEQKIIEQKKSAEEKERKRFGEWMPVYARIREQNKYSAKFEWIFLLMIFGLAPFTKNELNYSLVRD